jgi:WD40 repeat protein
LDQTVSVPGLCPHCLLELALESPSLLAEIGDPAEARTLVQAEGMFAEGQILGERYRVRALLGRGGMGEVWRAFDLKLRVDVALKALHDRLVSDERALETLRQEVRTAREVVSANVCRVYDLIELEGQELVSMEYVDGITLLDILRARAPLELTEAREIAAQFLAGLEAIHAAGLVHRDVKPENLMMTRAGRVVVMDFGIAKGLAEGGAGTVSGTPAYMAPEQARGEALTAAADVYAAGIVLAEMIDPGGLATPEVRQAIWRAVRETPPRLADSPWQKVLGRALAPLAADRHEGASALARALEEVTLRVEGGEGASPYPGLASFTREDAEYFFGRELEVEEMWKKLQRPHLLGLIGPSGAGKSSFLRAGLMPVVPTGWRVVIAAPGAQPFTALGQALIPEFASDTDAMREFLRFEEPDVAVDLATRWRGRHDNVLLVVDQFEELFTQNPPEVQDRFAELLGRLAVEANVRVLLSMRDDFLFHCSAQPALAPMFSELTPLRPPTGSALRRALVQPALKCGYRFEDDGLVDEMVAEVSDERGALPMLAFAAARLWEHRDREQGLLTREAYEHVGGVAGALAQHAERTLEQIGTDRTPIVREIFRNLVTAQGTRVARDREDLLSVFEEPQGHDPAGDRVPHLRDSAAEVLDTLVNARLLTAFEIAGDGEQEDAQRIEIIHESLLTNWPRLVRWQARDADSARLRDQLRQAARIWEERGRPEDLLWTGTSFKEYVLWRDDYEGGLTPQEESFAGAMTHRATRQRRRRRIAVALVVTLALGIAAVTSALWQRSESDRRRAEASELLALGRLELEKNHTVALAYVTSSLELFDTPEARRLALEILWRGPPARLLPDRGSLKFAFSPDGAWMAAGRQQLRVVARDGEELPPVGRVDDRPWQGWNAFSADSAMVLRMTRAPSEESQWAPVLERWRLPGLEALEVTAWDRQIYFERPNAKGLLGFEPLDEAVGALDLRLWSSPQFPSEIGRSRRLGTWSENVAAAVTDPSGERLLWARNGQLLLGSTNSLDEGRAVPLTEFATDVRSLSFSPDGGLVAASDVTDEIRVLTIDGPTPERLVTLTGGRSPDVLSRPALSPGRDRLAMVSRAERAVYLWDLETPFGGRPLVLRKKDSGEGYSAAFHSSGRWLSTLHGTDIAFWPMTVPYVRGLPAWQGTRFLGNLAFSPDSRWLAGCAEGAPAYLWPLAAGHGDARQLSGPGCRGIAFDPVGNRVIRDGADGIVLQSWEADGEAYQLSEATGWHFGMAFDGTGRRVAAGQGFGAHAKLLRVWDLATEEVWTLDLDENCQHPQRRNPCYVTSLGFAADGSLITGGPGGVRQWDLEEESFTWLAGPKGLGDVYLTPTGRYLFMVSGDVGPQGQVTDIEYRWTDLESGTTRRIEGPWVDGSWTVAAGALALDPSGEVLIVGEPNGTIRVGRVAGGEHHLLLGHQEGVKQVVVSPDGRWIASRTEAEIRLWPMPDLSQAPLHTLPHEELLNRLRSLTNLRVVEDSASAGGWRLEIGPFPGWEKVPTW